MGYDVEAARWFVYGNARLLEQRVYAVLFEDGDPASVVLALAGYQNADGGFGNGLEPDKRAPTSQALDVEIAFERLVMVGGSAPDLIESACDWLATVSAPSGAVPIVMPSIVDYPRAAHWNQAEYPPGPNPAAAIAAHVHALGITHPWADLATEYCLSELEAGRAPAEAHALLGLAKLLDNAPDQQRAKRASAALQSTLAKASYMRLDPGSVNYGLTPLDFAPSPQAMAHGWFDTDLIEAHLDSLEHDQQDDGGWPIGWEPPGGASRCEWRAIRTISSLRTLAAYQRLPG